MDGCDILRGVIEGYVQLMGASSWYPRSMRKNGGGKVNEDTGGSENVCVGEGRT